MRKIPIREDSFPVDQRTRYVATDFSKAELRVLADMTRGRSSYMVHDTIMIEIPRINRGWVWNA